MEPINFLEACKATDSRNKALEEIRDKGAEVILAVFRMFKNSLVHSTDNKAVVQTVEETHTIVTDFGATVGGLVSVTFVDDTIFVCGQLLRASRSIYEQAMEVGKLLNICGCSEISMNGDVTPEELVEVCKAFSISVRDPERRSEFLAAKFSNVTVRALDTQLQSSSEDDDSIPFF